jgi:hypothetical protein
MSSIIANLGLKEPFVTNYKSLDKDAHSLCRDQIDCQCDNQHHNNSYESRAYEIATDTQDLISNYQDLEAIHDSKNEFIIELMQSNPTLFMNKVFNLL